MRHLLRGLAKSACTTNGDSAPPVKGRAHGRETRPLIPPSGSSAEDFIADDRIGVLQLKMGKVSVLLIGLGSVAALQLPGSVRTVRTPSRTSRVICGWGPDPVWSALEVGSIKDAAEGLKAITIKPAAGAAEGFTIPGQYVQIREPGAEKAGIFAIASGPGNKDFEFLIKEQPASDWSPGTGWLTDASAGLALEMSQVMGPGFKIDGELDDVDSVLLFAVGSGISPIRSVMESEVLKDKKVTLYYGSQTPDQMAYKERIPDWEKLGVEVVCVVSKPDGTGWEGATGYVQDVAKAAGVPAKSAMLICGMKGMAEGVKELASESGVEKVIANF